MRKLIGSLLCVIPLWAIICYDVAQTGSLAIAAGLAFILAFVTCILAGTYIIMTPKAK